MFDAILDTGARPFVELGFMPRELATQTETAVLVEGALQPAEGDGRAGSSWSTTTVRHWIERYGIDEVRQWRFEVWNEPNLVPNFWTGTRTAVLRAVRGDGPGDQGHRPAAAGRRTVDERVRPGRPLRAGRRTTGRSRSRPRRPTDPDALDWQPVWIHEFIEWCAQRGTCPVDFLSTHLYPTDYAAAPTGQRQPIRGRGRHVRRPACDAHDHRRTARTRTPSCTSREWSTSPSSRDAIHDTLFAAAYIIRAFLKGAPLADSISYWTFTDVFEEGGGGIGPFHGGFGFVNEQGIHKPTFHAMAMLHAPR